MIYQTEVHVFERGEYHLIDPKHVPDWLQRAMVREQNYEGDRDRALSDEHETTKSEHYGDLGDEHIDVWLRDVPGQQPVWLIDWFDLTRHHMAVLVQGPIEFARFQAFWICPMASKLIAQDALLRATAEREGLVEPQFDDLTEEPAGPTSPPILSVVH